MTLPKHIPCLLRSFYDPSTILRRALLLAFLVLTTLATQAQSGDNAKDILRLSREKCQTIESGHYAVERKQKFMSGNDTSFTRQTCDFRKAPADTIFGMYFAMHEVWPDDGETSHSLYTGDEFVYSYDDSTGTVMSCGQWADKIIRISHNFQFYDALTNTSCYPLPKDEQLADSAYTFTLTETALDERPCYLVGMLQVPNEEVMGMRFIRYEVRMWIDKRDYLPVRYTIAYDAVQGRDTLCQFDDCLLVEFSPEVDSTSLTILSFPDRVVLTDYTPDETTDPLVEGTLAPDWSLPTLAGDTVRLSDLRGKVVLVDFFYKSCAPCCAALPGLQNLHEKYKDKGFVMIGIDPYDDPEKAAMADFLAKRDITYTVLFSDRDLPAAYHVRAFPTLFFIDRNGKITKVQTGFSKDLETALEDQLQDMLQTR